jgi:hypothetical protein
VLYASKEATATSKQIPLQELFAALSKCIGSGRGAGREGGAGPRHSEMAHLVKEAQDLSDSMGDTYSRARQTLKDKIQRAQNDSQSLIDDIIQEFGVLSREISEGVLNGEDSFELRILRDQVSRFRLSFLDSQREVISSAVI